MPHKKRNQPSYIKGRIAGILPLQFVADFAGLNYWPTRRLFLKWMKTQNKPQEKLTVSDLKNFIDYTDVNRRRDEGEVDDFINL